MVGRTPYDRIQRYLDQLPSPEPPQRAAHGAPAPLTEQIYVPPRSSSRKRPRSYERQRPQPGAGQVLVMVEEPSSENVRGRRRRRSSTHEVVEVGTLVRDQEVIIFDASERDSIPLARPTTPVHRHGLTGLSPTADMSRSEETQVEVESEDEADPKLSLPRNRDQGKTSVQRLISRGRSRRDVLSSDSEYYARPLNRTVPSLARNAVSTTNTTVTTATTGKTPVTNPDQIDDQSARFEDHFVFDRRKRARAARRPQQQQLQRELQFMDRAVAFQNANDDSNADVKKATQVELFLESDMEVKSGNGDGQTDGLTPRQDMEISDRTLRPRLTTRRHWVVTNASSRSSAVPSTDSGALGGVRVKARTAPRSQPPTDGVDILDITTRTSKLNLATGQPAQTKQSGYLADDSDNSAGLSMHQVGTAARLKDLTEQYDQRQMDHWEETRAEMDMEDSYWGSEEYEEGDDTRDETRWEGTTQ